MWPKGEGNFKPNTFLQFGKDYAGARDDYIYFYGRNETAWAKGTLGIFDAPEPWGPFTSFAHSSFTPAHGK